MPARCIRWMVALAILWWQCASGTAQPAPQPMLKNPDFTADALDGRPSSWLVLPPGTPARVVADDASPTKRSVRLGPPAQGQPMGNLMQQLDAAPFRGKRIIVRAEARLAPHETGTQLRNARAQMWVRVDREGGQMGFFDNMSDRPIRGLRAMNFQTYAISGVVDDDAATLNVGLMVFGETVAHVASFSILSVDAGLEADAPARAATDRGLDNLVALARLSGYIRYFHPSDEAAAVDWERFIAAGVEHAEQAADASDLASRLAEVFAPIAPTVQIWPGGIDAAPAPPPTPEGPESYTAWTHLGVDVQGQTPGRAIYTSRRLKASVDRPNEDVPAPGTSVVKTLAGGVSCRVPVTLYVDADGKTLPRAAGGAMNLDRPEWWSASADDRSARLAGVIVAWNVFQHFYPYFDVADAEWGDVLRRSLASAAAESGAEAYLKTLQRMVSELDDGHGSVISTNHGRPHPFDLVFAWVGEQLVVAKVGDGVEGIMPGDEVVAVGGVPTGEWYREVRGRISAATEQWARWRACSDHSFLAPTNDPVELTLRRDGKEFKATPPRVEALEGPKESRPESGTEVAPGIVYFDMNGAEVDAWQKALPRMQAAKGIILDMRGYPGGAGVQMLRHLTDAMIQSAKWNIPKTTLPDRENVVLEESGRWRLQPAEPRLGADGQNVVFITDGRAISYAESCMGIVEAYRLGEIVGGPTAGTNGNVNPFSVCGGFYIVWTGMKVIKHDDSRHHGVGIRPTVPVSRTIEGISAGRDELLEAAIKQAQGG